MIIKERNYLKDTASFGMELLFSTPKILNFIAVDLRMTLEKKFVL